MSGRLELNAPRRRLQVAKGAPTESRLEAAEGEVVALVGANGAGKTTMKSISGNAPATGGIPFAGSRSGRP